MRVFEAKRVVWRRNEASSLGIDMDRVASPTFPP